MVKTIKIITAICIYALATFPLFRENVSSIIIFSTSILLILNYFIGEIKTVTTLKTVILFTFPFWLFLIRELLSKNFNLEIALLHLLFLILPLLFIFKPNYLKKNFVKNFILIFQFSLLIKCLVYLFVFLKNNHIASLFIINNYNIPFFRNFISENYHHSIHSTYFSSFLLISFTLSLFDNSLKNWKQFFFMICNLLISSFFLLLFVSKVIILLYLLTIIYYLIDFLKKKNKKQTILISSIFLFLIIVNSFLFKNLLIKRFKESITQLNQPLIGDYHNSTNIRVAIYNCSFSLINNLPLLGYGNTLQDELNNCFEKNYESNFYKLHTYNAHNYYLNLILYGGFLFFALFFVYLIYIFKNSMKHKIAVVIFIQLLLVNFTENLFSRHYGIILFLIFICLFLSENQLKEEKF